MSVSLERLTVTIPAERAAALKADIDQGLADIAAGQVIPFNMDAIIARGGQLLATHAKKTGIGPQNLNCKSVHTENYHEYKKNRDQFFKF